MSVAVLAPGTTCGVFWAGPGAPSWPVLFAPQHWTEPSSIVTQLNCAPVARSTAVPLTSAATGVADGTFDPLPSCPAALSPQQLTVLSASTAHEWLAPAAMPSAPPDGQPPPAESTRTGVASVPPAVPSPSWPLASLPQHSAVPSDCTAHVC